MNNALITAPHTDHTRRGRDRGYCVVLSWSAGELRRGLSRIVLLVFWTVLGNVSESIMADRREGVAWLVRLGLFPRILQRHAIIELGGISKADSYTVHVHGVRGLYATIYAQNLMIS